MDRSSSTRYLHHRSRDRTRTRAAPLLKVIVTRMQAPRCKVSPASCSAAAQVGARTSSAASQLRIAWRAALIWWMTNVFPHLPSPEMMRRNGSGRRRCELCCMARQCSMTME
eukprot:3821527-Rhodomonas_salina.1